MINILQNWQKEGIKQTKKLKELLSTLVFNFAILFFIIGFGFTDTPTPFGWYQQFMPSMGSRQISDIFFIDSLNGWAVATGNVAYDTANILKTTDGGDSWQIKFTESGQFGGYFSRIKFLNQNTGFVCGKAGNGNPALWKSTNSGENWNVVSTFGCSVWDNMNVLNADTIWLVDHNSLCGGVFRTTNGGASWDTQASFGINNPSHIYMFNARIGFIDAGNLRKTTDGGTTWTQIPGAGNFLDMYFIDSLTGWKCNQDMKKTTDGGITWISQILPNGGNILFNFMLDFKNVNADTIWGVGGSLHSNNNYYGMIFHTIDSGRSWVFQIADTSIHIGQYIHTNFVNKFNGWAYSGGPGVHTVIGGDTIFLTSINKRNLNIPISYVLFQNYPNPFNPTTNINYQLSKRSFISIRIYDITGKIVTLLVDKKLDSGEYQITFDGSNYSSGVYFYSLFADGVLIDTKKMVLLK